MTRRTFAEWRELRLAELRQDPAPLEQGRPRWPRAQRLRERLSPPGNKARVRDSVETGVCVQCGYSHAPEERFRLIRRQALADYPLPVRRRLIQELWPCFYPHGYIGERQVYRDIHAVEATR